MANTLQMKARQEREKRFHPRFYDLFGKQKTLPLSRKQLSRMNILDDASESQTWRMLTSFEDSGYIVFRVHEGRGTVQPTHSVTLLMDRKDSWLDLPKRHTTELAQAVERGKAASRKSLVKANLARTAKRETTSRVSVMAREAIAQGVYDKTGDETVAIVGEDAPAPLEVLRPARKADDATALVEAARQYSTRRATIDKKLEELHRLAADMGVQVTTNVSMETDERLETIALVLPVIDGLEKMVARQSDSLVSLRQQLADYAKLKSDSEALRRQNQRLIAGRIQNGEAAHV